MLKHMIINTICKSNDYRQSKHVKSLFFILRITT